MTPDNRNNEPLDAILRRSMRAQPGTATPECADAESLAAYSERSLAAPERERLEVHFADCMRCQLMLADIARADDSARDAKAASEVPWYRKWRIAIPALTAVAAVLVFIAIRRPANEELQRDQLVAMAKQEAPRMEVAERAQAPAPVPKAQVAASAAQVATLASRPAASVPSELAMNEARPEVTSKRPALRMHHAARAPAPAVAPAAPAAAPAPPPVDAGRVVAIAPAAPVVEPGSAAVGQPTTSESSELATNQPQPLPQRAESMGLASREVSSAAAAPGAGAISAPQAGSAGAGAAIGGAVGAGSGAIVGAAVGHPEGAAAIGASAGGIIGAAPAGTGFAAAWPIQGQISPPDHFVTWIVGKSGTVQRRDANGAIHWQHSGVTTDLIAGAAPSSTVCWIVGRSGTIIRTTDGEHWELITAPSADNLTGVSARSARDATITTAGGQSFATSDGGASWHQQ